MSHASSPAAAPRLDPRAIVALMLSVIVVTIDISLTSTAVPAIAQSLGQSPASTIWIINIYYLTVVASLLPLAALGEIIGHRRVFATGLVVFAIGGFASGLSDSLTALMASRGLLGIGAAAVSATTPALIKTLYPPTQIGRGLGLYALVVGVAFTAGPTVVAAVLSVASWHWIYLANAPLALVALWLVRGSLPDTERAGRRFDPLAAILCALMFAALLTALSSIGHLKWLQVAISLATAIGLGYLLMRREAGNPAPILGIDLFRVRLFALSSLTSVTAFTVQALVFVVLPLLLTIELGYTPAQAGLLITPWPAALAIVNGISGRLSEHIKPGVLGAVGMGTVAIGLILIATLPAQPDAFDIGWRLVICGVGFGLFQSPNMVAMMNSAPKSRSGSAGGILATSRLLGQSIGAAAVALCLSSFAQQGIQAAIWVGVTAATLSASISAIRLTRLAKPSPLP
ncbi:MAG: MFS transporter [Burkholderiaceae bacterium]|nr:MFS transporter [Burkholderiaceae bacterium]